MAHNSSESALRRLLDFIPSFEVDLKYATNDNITNTVVPGYEGLPANGHRDPANVWVHPILGRRLAAAQRTLEATAGPAGRFIIFDSYRPARAQWALAAACPDPAYVADPAAGGSQHSFGLAIDLAIAGAPLCTPFDTMAPEARPDAPPPNDAAGAARALLHAAMTSAGLKVNDEEWWHYSVTPEVGDEPVPVLLDIALSALATDTNRSAGTTTPAGIPALADLCSNGMATSAACLSGAEETVLAPIYLRLTEKRDFSRLLYANPVCFLATRRPDGDGSGANVMTLSWLTCVNNSGLFMFSSNKRRFTAACLLACPEMVLSVPCSGMEALVLAVGKASGRNGDKLEQLRSAGLAIDSTATSHRHGPLEQSSDELATLSSLPLLEASVGANPLGAVRGTVAWMRATVLSIGEADADHHLVMAQIQSAAVYPHYWNGKHFAPKPGTNAPPYLAFLGSQTLVHTKAPVPPVAATLPSFPPILGRCL